MTSDPRLQLSHTGRTDVFFRRFRTRCRSRRRHPIQGYTLLEVVLSLGLASLVLLCVAMAVDFQLRIADAGRAHVEESQIARVLLHRIADDIRSAVVADPLGLADLAAPAGGSTTSGQGTSGSGAGGGADPAAIEDEGWEDLFTDEPSGSVQSLVPHAVPGLYGDAEWLQVDVGRPSRVQPQSYMAGGFSSCGSLGDVKTIAYYVAADDDATGEEPSGGLIRRELDRAVTAWASEQGTVEQLQFAETPIAPEVAAIGFRYSDGGAWYDGWDTAEAGGLPKAVEISLSIRPIRRGGNWAATLAAATGLSSADDEELLVYRLIVDVPMARVQSAGGDLDWDDAFGAEMTGMEDSGFAP